MTSDAKHTASTSPPRVPCKLRTKAVKKHGVKQKLSTGQKTSRSKNKIKTNKVPTIITVSDNTKSAVPVPLHCKPECRHSRKHTAAMLILYGMVPPDLCRWRCKLCGCLGMWTMPYSASYLKWFPSTNATAHEMYERTSSRTCEHQSGISTIKIWQW